VERIEVAVGDKVQIDRHAGRGAGTGYRRLSGIVCRLEQKGIFPSIRQIHDNFDQVSPTQHFPASVSCSRPDQHL
jgi:hypothetical protein